MKNKNLLNEKDLAKVFGGNSTVLKMDSKVMEQVIKNAKPLAPGYVNPNPGGLPKKKLRNSIQDSK